MQLQQVKMCVDSEVCLVVAVPVTLQILGLRCQQQFQLWWQQWQPLFLAEVVMAPTVPLTVATMALIGHSLVGWGPMKVAVVMTRPTGHFVVQDCTVKADWT